MEMYKIREAYSWTAANSIYVDKDYRRQGIGSLLYGELEKRLKEQGIVNLLAGSAFCDVEDEYLTHARKGSSVKSDRQEIRPLV